MVRCRYNRVEGVHSQCMHLVMTVFRIFCLHVEHFRMLCADLSELFDTRITRMRTMHLSTSSCSSTSLAFELEGLLLAIVFALAVNFSASFCFFSRLSSIFNKSWRLRPMSRTYSFSAASNCEMALSDLFTNRAQKTNLIQFVPLHVGAGLNLEKIAFFLVELYFHFLVCDRG